MFSGDYTNAEQAFADVARVLPLAEVVNNEGVAVSRQGHDGTSLFIQAAAADPNAADYHFNLALSLKRHGKLPGALNELAQCLKLRPNDSEAQSMEVASGGKPSARSAEGTADPDASAEPLERIARSFDEAAFRQAAAMLDEMNAGRLAALTPRDRARALCTQAKGFLDRGLLLEAERLYQDAVAADGKSAQAHAGLAEVRERSGDGNAAREEAHAALPELEAFGRCVPGAGAVGSGCGSVERGGNGGGRCAELELANWAAQDLMRQIEAKTGQRR